MTGEVVKFGNAEFHYRWTHEVAKVEYETLEALRDILLKAYADSAREGHASVETAFKGYRKTAAPILQRMADLKAAYWFAHSIILKGDL